MRRYHARGVIAVRPSAAEPQPKQKSIAPRSTHRGRPQPKLGISPAKTPRPLRSEKMVKRIRKNIYLSPPNLAPLRLGGRNFQIREFSTLKIFPSLANSGLYEGSTSRTWELLICRLRTPSGINGEQTAGRQGADPGAHRESPANADGGRRSSHKYASQRP